MEVQAKEYISKSIEKRIMNLEVKSVGRIKVVSDLMESLFLITLDLNALRDKNPPVSKFSSSRTTGNKISYHSSNTLVSLPKTRNNNPARASSTFTINKSVDRQSILPIRLRTPNKMASTARGAYSTQSLKARAGEKTERENKRNVFSLYNNVNLNLNLSILDPNHKYYLTEDPNSFKEITNVAILHQDKGDWGNFSNNININGLKIKTSVESNHRHKPSGTNTNRNEALCNPSCYANPLLLKPMFCMLNVINLDKHSKIFETLNSLTDHNLKDLFINPRKLYLKKLYASLEDRILEIKRYDNPFIDLKLDLTSQSSLKFQLDDKYMKFRKSRQFENLVRLIGVCLKVKGSDSGKNLKSLVYELEKIMCSSKDRVGMFHSMCRNMREDREIFDLILSMYKLNSNVFKFGELGVDREMKFLITFFTPVEKIIVNNKSNVKMDKIIEIELLLVKKEKVSKMIQWLK